MRKTREQRGITLIALIITIVVLLILAVVAIDSIRDDGIISHAGNTANTYNQAVKNEQQHFDNYLAYLDKVNGGGDTVMKVSEAQTKGILNASANTDVIDDYGNVIVVPAGFKITTDADTVPEGIVVEDGSENQFVWVPTGTVYTSANKATSETIELNRYTFNTDGTPVPQGDAIIYSYYQELATSTYGNATARNIEHFKTSVTTNGGYYIGRYEAAKENDTLICKAGKTVYTTADQSTASSLSQAMYADGYSTGTFSSDLVNSYAWDTAIVFIQKLSTKTNAGSYSKVNVSSSNVSTGVNNDEYCNINDMSGNWVEWSTETYTASIKEQYGYSYDINAAFRGGHCSSEQGVGYDSYGASGNRDLFTYACTAPLGFGSAATRVILYVS